MSEFGVRKTLLIEKTPTEKMGDRVVPQIHLAYRTRLRVLRAQGNTCEAVLVGQVFNGGL